MSLRHRACRPEVKGPGRVPSEHSLRLQSDCAGFAEGMLKVGKKKRCGVQAERGWGPERGLRLACGGVVSEW